MTEIEEPELAEIGRNAATQIDGLGEVDRVKVITMQDSSDRPAHFFTFLIDRGRDRQQVGLALIRLQQKIRDELIARDDGHYPYVQVLDQSNWERLEGA